MMVQEMNTANSAEKSTIGQMLKARRQERGLTIEGLADLTRIRRNFLLALEDDRFDNFPGDAYLTGFLRVYASALGLDPEQLKTRYFEQVGRSSDHSAKLPVLVNSPWPKGRRRKKGNSWTWLAVIVLVVVALALVSLTLPETKPTPPASAAGAPALSPAPPVAPTGAGEPSAPPMPSPADGSAAPTPEVTVDTAGSPLTFSFAGNAEVRLQALGPNRIEVRSDSRPVQNYNLTAAAVLSWKVQNKAHIRMDDPAAVKIWLNDQPLDLNGRSEFFLQGTAVSGG
ncbi:MAG: helix-turn-helix domain-containing protein [Desulfuromonadales bacterium]|nr:helix-turn-helix domain-containing protein [Desulfuromonadales bacterium]